MKLNEFGELELGQIVVAALLALLVMVVLSIIAFKMMPSRKGGKGKRLKVPPPPPLKEQLPEGYQPVDDDTPSEPPQGGSGLLPEPVPPRRTKAALTACIGIPTEALEGDVVQELLTVLRELSEFWMYGLAKDDGVEDSAEQRKKDLQRAEELGAQAGAVIKKALGV